MTYQVYALKTRPQTFAEVIGQDPVVSAITHALDNNKLHHAYLFTGTRGVGKTTIARIIAKSLNCEQGVSSKPCNQCNNCTSINLGKFPDLIEIDAASKTKVEDTRSLLDTVIYSPSQGRYKIYLIDEVHMLSTHSFNALLKTLEEPPSHVKFLLATTDPHKIPATIISRCLQFTLKWVDSTVIAEHLARVLDQDGVKYESGALSILALAAEGSVRDSLSLLEQSVALGGGQVTADHVRAMLGSLPGEDILTILRDIINKDSSAVLQKVYDLAMKGVDFAQVLSQLIYNFHQIAIIQQAPTVAIAMDMALIDNLKQIASEIKPEDLQVYYQIALLAKRDLPYSPQPKLALEMALIRMLNFVPVNLSNVTSSDNASVMNGAGVLNQSKSQSNGMKTHQQIVSNTPKVEHNNMAAHMVESNKQERLNSPSIQQQTAVQNKKHISPSGDTPHKNNWHTWLLQLNLTGIQLQIVKNTELVDFNNNCLTLLLDSRVKALVNQRRLADIQQKISSFLQQEIKLEVANQDAKKQDSETMATPASIERAEKQQKHEELVAKLQNDPNIENIMKTFNGELKLDSVELTEDS